MVPLSNWVRKILETYLARLAKRFSDRQGTRSGPGERGLPTGPASRRTSRHTSFGTRSRPWHSRRGISFGDQIQKILVHDRVQTRLRST
jgi:hypothetical protein